MHKSKISLCLIAGLNEHGHLARCIKSFSWAIDSFFVISATGKDYIENGYGNICKNLAEELNLGFTICFHKNKSLRFSYCDDFSKARQESFDMADGDWLIWADCDDVLEDTEDNRAFFEILRSGQLDKYPMIRANWKINNAGGHTFVRERIVRKDANPKWLMPVHEMILPIKGSQPIYAKELTITHDPILASKEEGETRAREHSERNIRILRYALHQEEHKPYLADLLFLWMREAFLLGYGNEVAAAGKLVLHYQRGITQDALYEARQMLGKLAHQAGNLPEARMHYLCAFGVDPNRREAIYDLALLDKQAGRFDRMLGYTKAARGIPLPPAYMRPYNCNLAAYGWWGASIHASALRLNRRFEEAAKIDSEIFQMEKGKISIIHPTRKQPHKAAAVRSAWTQHAENQGGIDWVFAISKEDNTAPALNEFKIIAAEIGVLNAIREALAECKGEIIGLMTDEFFPAQGWDAIVIESMKDGQNVAWVMGTDLIFVKAKAFSYSAPEAKTFCDLVHSIIQGAIKAKDIAVISADAFQIPRSEYRLKDEIGIYPHTIRNKNRFVIVSKTGKSPYPDFQPLYAHTELGWEATVLQMEAKHLLCAGKLHADDTIVTLPGREFLYRNQFKNVITWEDFCREKKLTYGNPYPDVSDSDTLDLVRIIERNAHQFAPRYFEDKGKYKLLPSELDAILNIEKKTETADHDYICMALRVRPHMSERNTSKDFSQELLEGIRSITNLPIYLVGLDLPPLDVKDVFHVDLQLWTNLTMLPNCKAIVTPLTGPANLAWIYAKPPTKFILFPRQYCASMDDRNIVTGMGEPINFNGNTRTVLPICCEVKEIVETVKKELES